MGSKKSAARRWGVPESVYVYPTPRGWRHSVVFVDGGRLCGRLPHLAVTADPETVRAAVREMIGFVLDGESAVTLQWQPAGDGWSATVEVGCGSGGPPVDSPTR